MKRLFTTAALACTVFCAVAQQGTLDLTFDPASNLDYNGAQGLALQPDGKIIVGGMFSRGITRLNTNGSLDATFNQITNGFNTSTPTLALQPDGKILVGGGFNEFNGNPVSGLLARLNSNGSLDATFTLGAGFNVGGFVEALALQTDGKIIVGGSFETLNGNVQNRIARLNANGTLDATFVTGTGFNNDVSAVAIQADGKILVGGVFVTYNGASVSARLTRLNTDGTVDASFNIGTGFNGWVKSIAIQPNGKIVVGGMFSGVNGTTKAGIVRLESDGSVDASFNVGTGFASPPFVHKVVLQPNGKVLVGGQFTSYNGVNANRMLRLNSDGSIDAAFNTGTACDETVYAFCVQPDERIIVAGGFTTYNGVNRRFIARLIGEESVQTGLVELDDICTDQTVSIPFVADGTFNAGNIFTAQISDATGSFTTPTNIGTLTGTTSASINATLPANLPSGSGYRVRVNSSNPAVTGKDNGIDLEVENIAPAVITALVNTLSTTLSYSSYQWYFNNTVLAGATNPTHTATQNGNYRVAVTNAAGCKDTSDVFAVSGITSLNEIANLAKQIKTYPNPATSKVFIEAPFKVTLQITGVEGKLMKTVQNTNILDLDGLSQGLYLLRIFTDDNILIKTEKLSIQH